MPTANGGENNEEVNGDLQINSHHQEENHDDSRVSLYFDELEEEDTFINNNNLEIEENNNYQTIADVRSLVPEVRICQGCDCSKLNQSLRRIKASPTCICRKYLKEREWNAETQCCFHQTLQSLGAPKPQLQSSADSNVEVSVIPQPFEPLSPKPKRNKKRSAFTVIESPAKRIKVKSSRRALSTKTKRNVTIAALEATLTEKKPQTEICFVSCGAPLAPGVKEEEVKTIDPFAKLSLSSREKRAASDTLAMYDHRQFAESSGGVAASSYYNPNKIQTTAVTEDVVQNNANTAACSNLDSNKTIATLCNIGNSCYLNSVVYTLRFAPLFLHKLHHLIEDMATIYVKLNPTKHKSSSLGRNVSLWYGHSGRSWSSKDLTSLGTISGNDMLPKNNQLIVTEKLHELYQNLHKNEANLNSEPLHAGAFLQAIQEVSSIFEGNQQQDAHECLMCILDSIRETCDTLATAIIDNPEQLVSDYGVCPALLEESRDELAPMPTTGNATTSQLKTGYQKLFSRKSKRKKSEDEKAPGDSPVKEHQPKTGEDSETTSPTEQRTEEYMKNLLLKALVGGSAEDITDKEKLKKAVCQRLGLNFFCEDFEGVTVSSIKCLTCESVRNCEETMVDVSVPITGHENPDSMSNPQLFFQNSFITKEYFCGENKYRCESCYGYTEAIRSISYEVLPRLLVIHLKRFSGGMEKINSYIPTPFTLHCFCNACIGVRDEEKRHIYKLYSVITHVGATMSVGHYVAYTCSLDILNEAGQCPNQRDKSALSAATKAANGNNSSSNNVENGGGGGGDKTSRANAANGSGDKKRLIRFFGSRKASSSGDISKNLKGGVNGLVNKVVANGIEKLSLNGPSTTSTTLAVCQGGKCCGIHVKNSKLLSNNSNSSNSFVSYLNGHLNGNGDSASPPPVKASSELSLNGSGSVSGAVSEEERRPIGPSHISQDYWYMCDDDKIKVMSQQQFEEYLSPNRKNMITPYLLFYARFDNNQTVKFDSNQT